MIFSVVDVETTGGKPEYAAITEIAIVKTDGQEIIDTYESLVNPETSIPSNITRLTGITNDMVADKPVFEKLSNDILGFLKGSVFVAHNVHFDHGFVRDGMKKSGIELEMDLLCSVQYSRKLFPGLSSYSLGSICAQFGISNKARHRAMGDALATTELLKILINHDKGLKKLKLLIKRSNLFVLPANVHADLFNKIPHSTGVYRFLNRAGKPIYIGKAKDLKSRVRQHFTENGRSKFNRFRSSEIFDINWTETGSEIVAMILEDSDIRKHWPIYNKAQKFQSGRYRIIYYQDQSGNYRLGIQNGGHKKEVLMAFDSISSARNQLIQLVNEYKLNAALCNVFSQSNEV
jgi:DNA polymerase-3 subunit epsilon